MTSTLPLLGIKPSVPMGVDKHLPKNVERGPEVPGKRIAPFPVAPASGKDSYGSDDDRDSSSPIDRDVAGKISDTGASSTETSVTTLT